MYKLKLRGEICMGFGSFLSLAGLILLIFVHVGQTNTSSTPRGIAIAKLNVSAYGNALAVGFSPDPITGLNASNASLPLGRGLGIRNLYQWGLYGYCGYLDPVNGTCSNITAAARFTPYDSLVADMSANYSRFTDSIIDGTSFRDSALLGGHTHAAYYLIIIGTVLCFVSLLLGFVKHTFAFLLSASLASVSALFILIGTALWVSVIHSAQAVNELMLAQTGTPLGIIVTSGKGLTLLWAAFGCLTAALLPYWISSCTFRG